MRGVILAGGKGSRLEPSTKVTNKHLLCVFNKPMVFFPLETLADIGIEKVLIITGKEHAGDMIELLGSGSNFGMSFTYRVQDSAGGIAQALSLAADFVGRRHFVTILGDNIIEDAIEIGDLREGEAKIFLKQMSNPQRFGVAEIKGDKIITITEKPLESKSDLAVIGLYVYDSSVFPIISSLGPSARGELEITDVNNAYIRRGKLKYSILEGFWSDMGTPDSLLRSAIFAKQNRKGELK